MYKLNLNKLVAVLFPLVLALLILWTPPSSSTLKADDGGTTSMEDGKSNSEVIVVPTAVTNKSLQELTKADYSSEDSLNKPLYLSEAGLEEVAATDDQSINMGESKVSVKTGTADFDTSDDPGYDSNDTNTLVRSHDQVTYLVSFTIQNSTKDKNYTNIRYRLKATLPNAITQDVNGVPQVNGEIANGTYYDTPSNDGTQYSEGVMESTISNTGQIFIPVVVNVFDATNGTVIQPSFELTILDAEDMENGETEAINHVYDTELAAPQTTVSAKPSVEIQLVAGERKKGTEAFGGNNANLDAYSVGAVTVLRPLDARATGDYRRASFPSGPITYTLKQKGTYQASGSSTTNDLATTQYTNYSVGAYAPATYLRTASFTKNFGTVNTEIFTVPLAVPNAKTNQIYSSQPNGALQGIGVYDSGMFDITSNGDVTNSDYVGVVNPYTYLMTGIRTSSAAAQSFSSLEMILSWDRTQTETLARANNWNRYDMSFYVDSVSYDGLTTTNDSSISYPNMVTPAGAYTGGPVLAKASTSDLSSELTNLDLNEASPAVNTGNARLASGDSIVGFNFVGTTNDAVYEIDSILMWDPSALKYDTSREPFASKEAGTPRFMYGTAKNFANSPPTTMQVYAFTETEALYDWYASPQEAEASGGEISAVACYAKTSVPTGWKGMQRIPLTVIQKQAGNITPAGNPLTLLTVQQFKDNNGDILYDPVRDEPFWPNVNYGKYLSTQYDSSGNATAYPMLYVCWIGESAYVNPFSILTKTEVEKELYDTSETISMKITGTLTGTSSVFYDGALTTTLPKGIQYQANSSKDGTGGVLPEPTITNEADGTTKLRWDFSAMPLTTGVEVNFKAISEFPELSFDSSGMTDNLAVKTVGEMWRADDSLVKDESAEAIRSSSDTFKEQLIQQIIVSKKGDKKVIEVGDDTPVGTTDAIKYTMTTKNESAQPVTNVRISDVLPYNGDSRGTVFHGDYEVTDVEVDDPDAKIFFTTEQVDESTDPNEIDDWTLYVSETSDISKAKGLLVKADSLGIGKTLTLTVTVDPTNQQPGDVLVNNVYFNSHLDMVVRSQNIETKVYGRDLSGIAWYDDNTDGLIGDLSNGSAELPAKEIPVKLYRTSFVDETYQNEVVKESLLGEPFIDESGNSLIKTDETGKYIFKNLPEGKYIAEFVVGDQVVQKKFYVTTPLVGDDPSLNSKADQETFKTPEYILPELKDLAADKDLIENTCHVTDVNIGLIRPSTIRLFKYETGTAVDANDDGTLSDVEKASGKALANATFELYRGNDQTHSVGTATTDESGYLNFIGIEPGEYNLIETQAPVGYEVIKEPIKVTITEGNQTIMVYQEDDKATELPHAGGNSSIIWLLGVASACCLIGIWAFYSYYHRLGKKGA